MSNANKELKTQESKLATILKWMVCAVAFVPLIIFSNYISPFHFGKVVIFRSLVEIMAVFYIALILRDKSYRPKASVIMWSFLGFALAFSITTATSVLKYQSFWGGLERMGGLFTFWHYFLFFLMLISVFRTEKDWWRLLDITIFVSVLSAFYGFGQKTSLSWIVGSGDRARIFGTLGNAALFAGYEIVSLFLALTLYFRPGISFGKKNFYIFALIINGIAILMTAVRGSLLGMLVGFVVFAVLYGFYRRSALAKKATVSLLVFVVLFVSFAFAFKKSNFVQNSGYLRRVTDFSLATFTVQTRFWAWQAGFQGWSESVEKMVFGWGPENFNIPFSKHFNPKFFNGPGSETLFDRAHNMFVEILVTMGLLGFLTYVSIFIFSIWRLWKILKSRTEYGIYAAGLISLIVAYMIHNSFIFDTSANFIVFFTILGFVYFIDLKSKQTVVQNNHKQSQPVKTRTVNLMMSTTAAMLLGILALFLIYKTDIQTAKANYATTRAIVAGWGKDFAGAIAKYKDSVAYDVPGRYDYRHRLAQYVLEYGSANKLTQEIEEALLFSLKEVQKNIDENDIDYLPYLYASRINIVLGKNDKNSLYNDEALKFSFKALELSPTFVRTYYEIAQGYLNKGDFVKASEYFQKAAELNPSVGLSYWYWSSAELQAGQTDKAFELMGIASSKGYVLTGADYGRLIDYYVKQNNLPKVAELFESLIKINSQNAQHHASLASAYSKLGRVDDAVAQARLAAQLDPSFETEARAFVQSLGRQW